MDLNQIILAVCAAAVGAIFIDIRARLGRIEDRLESHGLTLAKLPCEPCAAKKEGPGWRVVPLLFAGLLLWGTGCASNGTRHKDAYALDVWTDAATPLSPAVNGQIATVGGTTAGRTHVRERHTTTQTPPATAAQRFGTIVGTGAGVGTLALVACLILCPSAVAAFALRRFFAFRRAFRETVAGVQLSGVVDTSPALSDSLKAAQSQETRILVQEAKTHA